MSRTSYESESSLQAERRVMEAFSAARPGWSFNKLPKHHCADFIISKEVHRGGNRYEKVARGFAEVKSRTNNHDQYPTLMLSLNKWLRMANFSKHTGLFFGVAVEYLDGIYFYRHKHENADKYKVVEGGRTKNTRDDLDIEWVIHIPVELTRRVDGQVGGSEEEAAGG